MLTRARDTGAIRMVDDQRLQPTATADLAPALVDAVIAGRTGLLHLTSPDACSWFEFTQAIMELTDTPVDLQPVKTTTSPGQPDRPLNGVLASTTYHSLPPWRDQLSRYLRGG